jgi:hypothetical protein
LVIAGDQAAGGGDHCPKAQRVCAMSIAKDSTGRYSNSSTKKSPQYNKKVQSENISALIKKKQLQKNKVLTFFPHERQPLVELTEK